ncbi:MAG: ribosome maturation factor RimM [Synergistaceae bacterium]|nr:ribosome maturation factor RimM [Synergistaceae bacterium]
MSTSPDASSAPRRVQIGKIVGAHGVKGTLRIHPLTDFPERFLDMGRLYVEKPGKPPRELEVQRASSHDGKGQILVKAAGVDGRDEAEALSGWAVTVLPEERVDLPDGEYWIDSLIGLKAVVAASGDCLGTVEDVMTTGGNDVYAVRTAEGDIRLIPAIGDVVREIDISSGVIRVDLIEGLWD